VNDVSTADKTADLANTAKETTTRLPIITVEDHFKAQSEDIRTLRAKNELLEKSLGAVKEDCTKLKDDHDHLKADLDELKTSTASLNADNNHFFWRRRRRRREEVKRE